MAGVQPLQLHFSQDGATPSGQLANIVGGLCLNSQPVPPVPLFSETGGPCGSQLASQQQDMVCSDEVLGTQDFITPADQFGVEGEPGNAAAQQRSPARLSPNRVKRPRHGPDGALHCRWWCPASASLQWMLLWLPTFHLKLLLPYSFASRLWSVHSLCRKEP